MNFVLPAAGSRSSHESPHDYPYSRADGSSFSPGAVARPSAPSASNQINDSSAVRDAITGRAHVAPTSASAQTSRAMVKPLYEQAETPEDYARLAATRNRATYDAASFCVEGPRRRLKSGPGWEGPAAYRDGTPSAPNPALYSTHRFHTKSQHKPSVRAGTDGMLRSLGFHHVADTPPAGAPSSVRNRYIDDSASMNRGPAMTVNSQIMHPARNPLTGHNMGEEYKYAPGERRISRKRMGKQSDTEFHMRRGQVGSVTTHTRMFGETYVDRTQASGLRTHFGSEGDAASSVQEKHDGHDVAASIFPQSKLPIDHDRREDQALYQKKLWKMHESLPGYREAAVIKSKYGY